jgi:indolepyruvate decarboxylase
VGELNALAGIAGSYAEHLPLFHFVGAPNMSVQATRALMHHTLGNGEYDLLHRMSSPVVCASAASPLALKLRESLQALYKS